MDRDSLARLREEHEHYFLLMRLATDRRLQDRYAALANKARNKLGALESIDRRGRTLSLMRHAHTVFHAAMAKLKLSC